MPQEYVEYVEGVEKTFFVYTHRQYMLQTLSGSAGIRILYPRSQASTDFVTSNAICMDPPAANFYLTHPFRT